LRSATIAAVFAAAVLGTIVAPPPLRLLWNTTASTPIGLYAVTQATPKRGDLLVTRLPRDLELLAVSRAILSPSTPVLKPVAGLAGDVACRAGLVIRVNGRFAAIARAHDHRGRRLPTWRGCRRLSTAQVFLLARHPDSFDSRYYGPLDARLALGIAHPLVTFAD
jgi:conjugative transfer signal peptidase TraF